MLFFCNIGQTEAGALFFFATQVRLKLALFFFCNIGQTDAAMCYPLILGLIVILCHLFRAPGLSIKSTIIFSILDVTVQARDVV